MSLLLRVNRSIGLAHNVPEDNISFQGPPLDSPGISIAGIFGSSNCVSPHRTGTVRRCAGNRGGASTSSEYCRGTMSKALFPQMLPKGRTLPSPVCSCDRLQHPPRDPTRETAVKKILELT